MGLMQNNQQLQQHQNKWPGNKSNKQQPYYNQYQQQQQQKNSQQSQFSQSFVSHSSSKHHHSSSSSSNNRKSLPASSSNNSSSSVVELPETFGLPSNSAKLASADKSKKSTEIAREDQQVIIEDNNQSSPQTRDKQRVSKAIADDIVIIGEHLATALQNQVSTTSFNKQVAASEDTPLKNYISKIYPSNNRNTVLTVKPQSNFMSNLSCINQLLAKNGNDFYTSKIRRCRPYSSIRPQFILNDRDGSGGESDSEDGEAHNTTDENAKKKPSERVRGTKCILIDDSNEDSLHKPWITPELIKLIKHRNLLQAKLSETGGLTATGQEAESEVTKSAENQELLKKFRMLRNKVTKLVKKARKDYLAKYVIENKAAAGENGLKSFKSKTSSITTTTTTTLTESSTTVNNLDASVSTASLARTASNATVNELLGSKLNNTNALTFLKDQTKMMNNLYTTYYNDYIKQYTEQQQKIAAEAAKLKEEGSGEKSETMDALQKQAAYYAEQQRAIQKQLESSLVQSAEQLIQEIAHAASDKANQPQVLPPPPQQINPLPQMPFFSGQHPQQQQQQQQGPFGKQMQHMHMHSIFNPNMGPPPPGPGILMKLGQQPPPPPTNTQGMMMPPMSQNMYY
jgi:hypothetical protein